jgi:hypothetical protein
MEHVFKLRKHVERIKSSLSNTVNVDEVEAHMKGIDQTLIEMLGHAQRVQQKSIDTSKTDILPKAERNFWLATQLSARELQEHLSYTTNNIFSTRPAIKLTREYLAQVSDTTLMLIQCIEGLIRTKPYADSSKKIIVLASSQFELKNQLA